ncbi:hypothetical protein C8J57DRAFT_1252847 [Mycena rebaudengoi]|nr:hypothetical protein C8J57DRAFT_1252847 [Mycena rebaudengoi]
MAFDAIRGARTSYSVPGSNMPPSTRFSLRTLLFLSVNLPRTFGVLLSALYTAVHDPYFAPLFPLQGLKTPADLLTVTSSIRLARIYAALALLTHPPAPSHVSRWAPLRLHHNCRQDLMYPALATQHVYGVNAAPSVYGAADSRRNVLPPAHTMFFCSVRLSYPAAAT